MTPEERLRLALDVLERSRAPGTEVTVTDNAQALTRFTHEAVSQNVDQRDSVVRVRAIVDDRIGIASTNLLDADALDAAVARADEIARLAPRERTPPTLAEHAVSEPLPSAFVAETAQAGAGDRARIAADIFAHAERNELWSSGYAMTAQTGITIVTSSGARMSFDGTQAAANVKMSGRDSTGFAECYSAAIGALDGAALGREAARIAGETRAPMAVDPGAWTVILAPAAIGELLRYVTLHFSAEAYSDGSSCIAGLLGKPIFGGNVTLRDDYAHPLNPGMPFDFEGVPTDRVTLVENGIAREIVTDSSWAQRLGRRNTGHAVSAHHGNAPQSTYAALDAGSKPLDQLVAETKRGLLITRLWYVRIVDQRHLLLTGMTRDGTFLIEDGRIRGGVRNMRFNQSMIAALRDCEIADTPVRTGSYHYSLVTPAVKCTNFHFASVSPY